MLSAIVKRGVATRASSRLYSVSILESGKGKESYGKADDYTPEPTTTLSGSKTYVVSEPDPSDHPHEVPR